MSKAKSSGVELLLLWSNLFDIGGFVGNKVCMHRKYILNAFNHLQCD